VPPITTTEPSKLCRKRKGLGCDGSRFGGSSIQRPQSSSASRLTAGAFEFLTFTQCRESKNPRRRPIWNTYCFICGSTFLAGVNFEPLWVRFTDMYIL